MAHDALEGTTRVAPMKGTHAVARIGFPRIGVERFLELHFV